MIAALVHLKTEMDQPVRMIGPAASSKLETVQNDLRLCSGQQKTAHRCETTATTAPTAQRIKCEAAAGAANPSDQTS